MDKPITNKKPYVVFIAILVVLLFSTIACSFTNIRWLSGDQAKVTVVLDEDTINSFSKNEFVHAEQDYDLLDDVTRIDMMGDQTIRVYGTYRNASGGVSDGSYDAIIAAEDGNLSVEIIAVDIDGLQIDDPMITRLNKRLAREMAELAVDDRDKVRFNEVNITEENIEFVLEFDWEE